MHLSCKVNSKRHCLDAFSVYTTFMILLCSDRKLELSLNKTIMSLQCSDVAMDNSSTNRIETSTLIKHSYSKQQEMDRKQHTKLGQNVPDTLYDIPQHIVPARRHQRQQARLRNYISETLSRRWDEIEEQLTTTSKPSKLSQRMEPIICSIYNGHSKGFSNEYVLETTISNLSFMIMRPNHFQVQLRPFNISLTTLRLYKTSDSPRHYAKHLTFYGLFISSQSNAYFYFRPAQNYRNILIEGTVNFHSIIRLRLTRTACCQPLRIPKGTHVGTLHPVLLTKYAEKQ